ncbi:hypothetical protein GCM10022224_094990 [Nonomuraea antimicrobica]|uniref:NlpC/P60 domain-containing protein n=1 Tax=Nonomuraea antimicrobica TaxID=561173 RepID=A0ABP7E7B3_9ACTN
MGGVVLLAGLAGSAHITATTTTATCHDTSRAKQPQSPSEEGCGHFPDLIPAEGLAGPERGLIAAQAALLMRGTPYSWGGGGPNGPSFGIQHGTHIHGFDCSGLAEYAWAKAGARIGGHTATRWNAGTHIPRSQIRPGDLIFFARDPTRPATIHHVGIAVDATHMCTPPPPAAPSVSTVGQELPIANRNSSALSDQVME